jgi:hypothetical protein
MPSILKSASWLLAVRVRFDEIAGAWRIQLRRLCDPYRPELYYMRGPGPKCREKLFSTQSKAIDVRTDQR